MNGAAFLWVLAAGAVLDRAWLHRDAVAGALLDGLERVLRWASQLWTDPVAQPPRPAPRSAVRVLRQEDDPA